MSFSNFKSTRGQARLCSLLAAWVLMLGSVPARTQSLPLLGKLKLGPYGVGFRSSVVFDSSRMLPDGKGPRPVQVSVWYPAQIISSDRHLQYRDYFLASALEQRKEPLREEEITESLRAYKNLLGENGIADSVVDKWFSSECFAVRGALPTPGIFPVVLIAQGMFHSAHHQALLSEFIASFGLVVLTTPSQARISGPPASNKDAAPHAEEQAKDLVFALRSVGGDRQVDSRRVGLVAHSFGARSAFLIAMRNRNVRALVSLDGGIANKIGKEWLGDIADFDSTTFTVPILHFYQEIESYIIPDFGLLESLSGSERMLVHMPGMKHVYFSSAGMAAAIIPGFTPNRDKKLQRQCEAVYKLTVRLLLASLQGDQNAQKALIDFPTANEYPAHILLARKLP